MHVSHTENTLFAEHVCMAGALSSMECDAPGVGAALLSDCILVTFVCKHGS